MLLRLMPDALWAQWQPEMETVSLEPGEILDGSHVHYVYFPLSCVVSVMRVLVDGASAQTALIGCEGFIGAPALLGDTSPNTSVMVQCPGLATRVPVDLVASQLEHGGAFMQVVLRHAQAVMSQMAQTAVCNRHHSPEQQLCRWLLMTLDRVDGTDLAVTQELIAMMLGVRRETVSETARKLRTRGIVDLRRGHVRVLNRARLEQCACECYSAIQQEYVRLFSRLLIEMPPR